MIRNIINAIKSNILVVWTRILLEKLEEVISLTSCYGSTNQFRNVSKLQGNLQIRIHALEKGMSIGAVKVGFGKKKVFTIMEDLDVFMNHGGKKSYLVEAVSVIHKYVVYNDSLGADMSDVSEKLIRLCKKYHVEFFDIGGIVRMYHSHGETIITLPFDRFSQSRYSIRDFSSQAIDLSKIDAALKLCERTPSACNRQSWRVHVYTDKRMVHKMFVLQGGSKGFDCQMQCAILVCTDLRNYGFYEQNLPYVDGGLYAMNLLYALHFYNLATIPLTMGHKCHKTNMIKKEMGIPKHEVPVLLIGVGSYKNDYKVAVSYRYPYNSYVNFNK